MGGYAWVTLATNDSYSLGALVLAHSLKQVGTQQQLAVLVTPGVTGSMREKLNQVFDLIQEVNILDSKDEANLRLLKRPELGITFTKLHCWRLTQFDKCVFLDADTLVLENCDELFEREELSAAPDVGWPDCFNSGVFVYRPSTETYEKLIQFALDRGSFDGGDQGLLNLFFSDWAHKDISKHLPFIYNLCSTACYSYLPAYKQFGRNAKIIHFIGATKPWLQYFDTESRKVHPSGELQHLQDVLQHWWNIFCSLIHPNLTSDMTPSHTDTVHGSQPYVPQRHVPPPPNYYTYQHVPSPDIPNPAEDYQNLWDPWEEYDMRQSQNQSNSNQSEINQTISHSHSYQIQEQENHNQIFQSHSQPTDNQNQYVQDHNKPFESREPNYNSFNIPESHYHTQHETQSHHIENNQQNQLVESHNTNACLAGHHDSCDYQHSSDSHNSYPPPPTYSQPQHHPAVEPVIEFTFHEPHRPEKITAKPTPTAEIPCPRLPDECVATTTVSNDISLNTGTNEDSNDNSSGLAGAFAQLTLGTPRTAEQSALDDHLRRQGWEVGNIDYLGRDSFENIWSKICETLSSAPEPTPKPKDPSPPKTTEDSTLEQLPTEVVSQPQPAASETPVLSQTEPVAEVVPQTEAVVKSPTTETSAQPEASTPIETIPPSSTVADAAALVPTAEVIPQPTSPSEVEPPSPQPTPVTTEGPQPIPDSIPSAPVPVSPQPTSEVSEAPQPTPKVPATIEPPSVVPETSPQPVAAISEAVQLSPTPESSEPSPVLPESPQPQAAVPKSTAEISPSPEPIVAAPKSIPPPSAAPETPQPVPVVPETPQPAPTVPKTPQPAPAVPETSPEPVPVVPESPQPAPVAPETPPSAPTVVKSVQPTAEVPETPKSTPVPESPKPVSQSPQPPSSPKAEATPQVCPVTPKPVEKKTAKKSAKEAPPTTKAEVTETTTPSTPPPKPSKQPVLAVDTSASDTPAPASSSTVTPTPPPRKSSGAPKKTSTKPKK